MKGFQTTILMVSYPKSYFFVKKKIKFSATHPHPEGLSGLRDSRHSEQPSDTTRPRTSSETGKSLRAETQSRLIGMVEKG